jgi:hypothetical protein
MKKSVQLLIQAALALTLLISFYSGSAAGGQLVVITNKQQYTAGETIHFQAFFLQPAGTGNSTIFAELLDCRGTKLEKKMYPFSMNSSWGSIRLPENIQSAVYVLYCYTVNATGIETAAVKKIQVSGNEEAAIKRVQQKFTVTCFYEGNSFVAESPANILLKCTGTDESPVIASGKITDHKGFIYGGFTTDENGFATITLNPENKVQYFILAKNSEGVEVKQPLRLAAPSGPTLQVNTSDSSINYTVISYSGIDSIAGYTIEILAGGEQLYTAAVNFEKGLGIVKDSLKSSIFPEDLLTFRLTDKAGKQLCERIIYNYKNTAATTFLIVDTIAKKEAAVEIPAYVNNTGYMKIFMPRSDQLQQANSLEQLLQGKNARPFIGYCTGSSITPNDRLIAFGQNLLNSSPAPADSAARLLTLSGTAYSSENKPLKNKKISLIFLYRNFKKDFFETKTDQKGNFELKNLEFYDSVTVYYRLAGNAEDKNNISISFRVSPDLSVTGDAYKAIQFACVDAMDNTGFTAVRNDSSSKFANNKTLSEVVVTSAKEKPATEKFKEQHVSGQHNQTNSLRTEFDFIAKPEPMQYSEPLFQFLRGRIAGLMIDISGSGDIKITTTFGAGIGVYLNDMEIDGADLSMIADIQVKDLALVRYYSLPLKPRTTTTNTRFGKGSAMSGGGDLMIYTRRDFVPSEAKEPNTPKATIVGYNSRKPTVNNRIVNDSAQSLYWRPDWLPQKNELIYMRLPENSSNKNIQLIIEGINNSGTPFSYVKKLEFK